MYRTTLFAAAILTVVPMAVQAQDGRYDYKAMDAARRAATRSVANLTEEINTLSRRIPVLENELEAAYQTYRIRRAQFGDNDHRTQAARKAYENKTTHKRLVEQRRSQLQVIRKRQALNFLIEEGRKHNPRWSMDILRLRYPELF